MRGTPSEATIELQKQRLAEMHREGYIPIESAAKIAQCPPATIHTWVRTGKLKDTRKQFHRVFVSQAELFKVAGIETHPGPHTRIGPGIDRSPCGVAGPQVVFSQTKDGIRCPRCAEFRKDPVAAAEQLKKMQRVGAARRAHARRGVLR